MSHPVKSQAPPLPDVPRWQGITGPISNDLPEQADLIQTNKLIEKLKSCGVFEEDIELLEREKTVKRLESLYKEWLTERCIEMNIPESVTETVGGKIFPFGSYHLGARSKDAEVNALCVGPGFLERNDFFTSFSEKLKAQKEVEDIQVILEAFVPVIKLSYNGIEFDLVFAQIGRKRIPENISLLDDKILKHMDKRCIRSINGYRVTEGILSLVPNIFNFRLTLRAIKLWAKRHDIYSSILGFLGGISWAIMVARICQLYPNAIASTLVIKFFKVYSMWEWPIPIRLREVNDCYYNLPFWDPRINASDRSHVMPIVSPTYPQHNTSFNVSPFTLTIITEEIKRGHAIAQEIQQEKANWSKLFETPTFFEKYQHYVLLRATTATEKQHLQWAGLVESKIRLLMGILLRNVHVSLVHINPQPFTTTKDGVSTIWLIGLVLNTESKNQKIDLTFDFHPFTDTIYGLAKKKIYEEGMTVSATYGEQEQLSWVMPNASRKKIFSPKPEPAETHQISAAEPASRAPPVSECQPGTKRKGRLQPEISARKMKADKGSSQETKRTCSEKSPAGVSLSKSLPPGVRPPSTERPRTHEPEMPTKKFKHDLPVVELCDLSDLSDPPASSNLVKNGIKLHLIRRN